MYCSNFRPKTRHKGENLHKFTNNLELLAPCSGYILVHNASQAYINYAYHFRPGIKVIGIRQLWSSAQAEASITYLLYVNVATTKSK